MHTWFYFNLLWWDKQNLKTKWIPPEITANWTEGVWPGPAALPLLECHWMTGTSWETGTSNWTLSKVKKSGLLFWQERRLPPHTASKAVNRIRRCDLGWSELQFTDEKDFVLPISEHSSFCGYEITCFSVYFFSFAYEVCRRKISYLKRKGRRKKKMRGERKKEEEEEEEHRWEDEVTRQAVYRSSPYSLLRLQSASSRWCLPILDTGHAEHKELWGEKRQRAGDKRVLGTHLLTWAWLKKRGTDTKGRGDGGAALWVVRLNLLLPFGVYGELAPGSRIY